MPCVLVGTSGWQYKHWRPAFYPQGVPQRRWLEHYSGRFATVENDGTFYRLPARETFGQWRARTPEGFVMAVKASRYLTHYLRLRDPAEPVRRMLDAFGGLGEKLGPVTHDHTLVQSLVDEGTIAEDDAATHPHRSLLLRALDGRTVAEPDLTLVETYPGDRYLLCSDGLSGVVTEQTLHQTLTSVRGLDEVALRLVGLAIEGGGPDNITCVVADVIDSHSSRVPPTWQPVFAGAAASAQAGPPSGWAEFPGG